MKIKYSGKDKIFNIHRDEIPYLSIDMLDKLGVPNLYTTRYESFDADSGEGVKGLRLSIMDDDDINEAAPVAIANRARLAKQLGSTIEMECITDQEHTINVHVVKKEDLGPSWPDPMPTHRRYVDGLVTDIPDVLLTGYGGDCPPVYFADPVRGAVGIVHAGWKGTFNRIPEVAIAQMVVKFGCKPKDIYAAIGPGICVDCYEMGDEIYDAFAEKWGRSDADRLLKKYPATDSDGREIPGGKYHLNLNLANKMTLQRAGVQEDHIAVSNVCTMCNKDIFYSYRAGCMENHQAAMIINRFDR